MNIPETQKDLLAYLDRITRELGSTRGGRIQNRLDHFTTASITDSLAISRSLASQYLNELVRAGLVVKAGARPVCYFHRRSLERFFQSRIERSTYPSVEQLFATLGNGERLDFDRAIGHELSLAPCISQLCAALKYPPAGLPILLCGASGTGKGLLAELALEYGKNVGVLQQEAKLVSIDCSHYADDARALTHDLCADGGPADRASGGIVYLKDVDALSPAAQDALLEWASAQAGAIVPAPAVRLIFATSNEADSTECRSLTRRIPMSAQVPSLRERTQEEREELTLHFLKEEGRRIGRDILISRGAFRALAGTNFEENVRGLRDCITNCCAEAYLDTKGDSLEIRTYQLPSAILAGSALERSENDMQLIDTTRSIQSQADDRARHVLDAMLEPYESYREGTLDGGACSAQLVERARDLEDYLAFGQNPGRSKSDAYEQIADSVVTSVNELYSIDLSRKSSHLIAQGICLQLWPPASLSRWKSSHASELSGMRGSKYVQSDAADAIGNAVSLLKRDIPVLFSGTPCQISGLMAALGGTKTDKLLTVDFVCHGVPSPGVFASYLAELEKERGSRVRAYAFRDKRLGWKNFSVVATFENGETHTGTQTTDPYLYGFLQNLYLRPSCHECGQLRGKRHAADITLADLWGAETICPERDDDTGLSLVMTHTQKGRQALDAIGAQVTRFAVQNMESMTRMNPSLVQPSKPHDKRAAFFKRYRSHGFESERVMKLLRGPSAAERAAKRIAHLPAGAMRRIKNLITK